MKVTPWELPLPYDHLCPCAWLEGGAYVGMLELLEGVIPMASAIDSLSPRLSVDFVLSRTLFPILRQ